MKYKKSLLLFIIVLIWGRTYAQPILTLQDAIKIALENNYEIRISSNNSAIDQINFNMANAGMLPAIGATITNNNGIMSTSQTQSDGSVRERNDARNFNLNYGLGLDWTIFDGFRMFARYEQLSELQKLGENELKATILTKASDVIITYYDLVQQQQQLNALDTAVFISRLRKETARSRYIIGKSSELEVLNAQVDLNTDTSNLLRQLDLFMNTKISLNQLLARDPNTEFKVVDTIVVDSKLNFDGLSQLASKQNPLLRSAVINKRIAELELKQVKAARYPLMDVNTGYNFSRSQTPLGFTTRSSGQGFTYGISASVNLFNGFLQRKSESISGIRLENLRLALEQQCLDINAQLSTAFRTYLTNLTLTELEQKNRMIAKQNLDITMEKYRLGSITPIEFREAQLNYINALVRFSNAQYQAKISEVRLKEIAGYSGL
jgi:outer membrane protein